MALSTKVTSFSTGTGAGGTTVDVTLGFQPKAIWVWWSGRTESTDTVARADSFIGYGFGKDLTNRTCSSWSRDDNAAAETGGMTARNDSIVYRITTGAVADGALDIDATANWPSDGIRFIVDTQFGASMRIHIAAVGGTDIANVDFGTITTNASVGADSSITSLSYQPAIAFFSSVGGSAVNTIDNSLCRLAWGAAISAAKQFVHAIAFDPGSTTGDSGEYLLDALEISAVFNAATMTSLVNRTAFLTMLSNGFTLRTLEGGGALIQWMTINGGNWDIGSLLTQTDTTTDIVSSPSLSGAIPTLIMFDSACRVESTQDVATTPSRWSKGAATSSSEEGAQAEHGEQGSANTRVGTAIEFDASYVNLADIAADGDPQTIQGSMHVTTTAPDSFTCIMTDADPSQSFVAWVAVGVPVVTEYVPYHPEVFRGPILAQ